MCCVLVVHAEILRWNGGGLPVWVICGSVGRTCERTGSKGEDNADEMGSRMAENIKRDCRQPKATWNSVEFQRNHERLSVIWNISSKIICANFLFTISQKKLIYHKPWCAYYYYYFLRRKLLFGKVRGATMIPHAMLENNRIISFR